MSDHNGQVMWLARPAGGRHRHPPLAGGDGRRGAEQGSGGEHRNTRWSSATPSRTAHRPHQADPPPLAEPAATSSGARLDAAAVTAALSRLDPVHREILAETYFRGRTVTEAATTLGLPVDTVKARVYAAIRALDHAARAA
ncbi:sigma factor-like helix-turn-helix DNA-binding protein [Micromonospora sp. CPCC 206061]|uniref:sigma factor-like helix-turn-helix DNA-binding protein n=1 Tax=Micromonospora sp. CPCC 206061 TaxID=3122410 RepID=UPI002FF27F3D